MSDFKPKNIIQKLAFEKRGVDNQPEFERMIGVKPWRVPRTTARHWWVNGIKMPSFKSLTTLSDFFGVPLTELVQEEKKG